MNKLSFAKASVTKTAMLFAACGLASSLSFAQTAPASADASLPSANSQAGFNSQTTNSTQISGQAKNDSGVFSTSVQTNHTAQNQTNFALSKPAAAPAATNSGTENSGSATTAPAVSPATAPVQTTATGNSQSTSTTTATTKPVSDKVATSSTQLTQTLDGKVAKNLAVVKSGSESAVGVTNKATVATTTAVKNQADFAQSTANSATAHAQTTLASASDSLRDVQATTSVAVNDAVKSSVNETVAAVTGLAVNQEISNQVNTAVTQEIGKTIQSSITNSVNNGITQSIGL